MLTNNLFEHKNTTKRDPRYYQKEAVAALWENIGKNNKGKLISMATGTGKSIVQAMCFQEAIKGWPDTGILVVTTVKELVRQNYEELIENWPEAPVSLYSAGLKIKNLSKQIIIAGIQSIYKKAYKIPHRIDLLFIDECQDISDEAGTMFRKFIADLLTINPDMKIVGLSATPYRMRQGLLSEGENALFDEVVYDYSILQGITDGFLSTLISKPMDFQYDVSSVKISGGEFQSGQLERAVDKDDLTVSVVDELMKHGVNRRCWLVFCAGVDHAIHVRDEIRSRGITCETVNAKTTHAERDDIFRRYKAGDIRCITNIGVMTKGINIPQIDLISFLRPTKSAGLFVQMAGRGTRLFPQKENCLLLDHAGLLATHGPIDLITPKSKKKGSGDAPIKQCPECKNIVPASTRLCKTCGYEFPFESVMELDREAGSMAVLSNQLKTEKHEVTNVFYYRNIKEGKLDSLRIEYMCGMTNSFRKWVFPQAHGSNRLEFCSWWRRYANDSTPPKNVTEALERKDELSKPRSIEVRKTGKYFVVVGDEL